MEYEQGGHLIILSERKDHLLLLYQMMRNLGEHIYMLTGETSRKARTEVLNKLERLNKEDHYNPPCPLGTPRNENCLDFSLHFLYS